MISIRGSHDRYVAVLYFTFPNVKEVASVPPDVFLNILLRCAQSQSNIYYSALSISLVSLTAVHLLFLYRLVSPVPSLYRPGAMSNTHLRSRSRRTHYVRHSSTKQTATPARCPPAGTPAPAHRYLRPPRGSRRCIALDLCSARSR